MGSSMGGRGGGEREERRRGANGDESPSPIEQVIFPSTGSGNAVKLVFMISPKI